ncbi:hypothetical protein ACLMJK_000711 [Lecanora helva]
MSGSAPEVIREKWQHITPDGQYTPYYAPAFTPGTTRNITQMQFFPEVEIITSNSTTAVNATAKYLPVANTKMEDAGVDYSNLSAPSELRANSKKRKRVEYNVEDARKEFMIQPIYGLSPKQRRRWKQLWEELAVENELDPMHIRSINALGKLRALARLAGDTTKTRAEF